MGTLYITLFVLIPRLLFQSRIPLFILSLIVAAFVIYVCSYLLDVYFLQPVFPVSAVTPHVEFSFGNFIQQALITAILLASITGYRVFKKWVLDVQRISQLEQMNLKTELAQLRSQVNPHFLFNTLNNLFVLTKTDPERAAQVLLGLSDLLRYQ
jgi:sensor histidine kinase YesM